MTASLLLALEALRDQVRQAQDQLRHAHDREQQAQAEKARLLTLLEVEQQTRRDLEVKLLPAPSPKPRGNPRLFPRLFPWIILLLASVALLAAWVWPEWLTWGVENILRRYITN